MNAFHPGSKRRLIAVDHGARCVKLLLAEPHGHGLRVLDHKVVDLVEEGLLAPEEIRRHLSGLAHQWGEWPIALALPAHLSFSQVVDLPAGAGERDIPKVIEEQTGRLRGFSSSPLVYDAVRLEHHGKLQQPYFITIAREEDVEQHLKRTTEEVNEVRDVSGLASALVRALRAFQPDLRDCVLVDWGASGTVVGVVRAGQGVFASSFAMGSNVLAEAVAGARKIAVSEAETQLRAENLFAGPQKLPALCAAAEAWLAALRKVIAEWRQQEGPGLSGGQTPPVVLSGGVLQVTGLLEHLQAQPDFQFALWPPMQEGGDSVPLSDFAVACGTALEALRRPADAPSLLPPALRAHARHLRQMAGLNLAGLVVLIVATLLLAGATWRKASRVVSKRDVAQETAAALAQVQELENLTRQRDQAFEQFWPLLDQQERTFDLLQTLRVLQEGRARNDFWCVLLADNDSYARGTTLPPVVTNRFGLTNAPAAAEETPSKPAFIVELCVPAKGEQTLKVLSDMVTELRKETFFSRVDSLPAAQRRPLVDPKVLIPDRHFAVSIELADLGWRSLFQTVRLADSRAGTNALRRTGLPPAPRPRVAPGLLPVTPPSNGPYE